MNGEASGAHATRGVWLSLVTVGCWSVLPVTLRIASRHLDPYTLTWYRFVVSAFVLAVWLAARRELPVWSDVRRPRPAVLLLVATLGLVSNYVLYLVSLNYVSPTVGTVITQLGPLLLMLGGVWIFRERLSRRQTTGVVLLVAGLLLFFNRRLAELADLSGSAGIGAMILLAASVTWAMYGVAQKALLRDLASTRILLLIYIGATVLLAAFTAPRTVTALPPLELLMLGLSCLNTLVAYGALAEALRDAGAATVGAVLAVGPVATLIVTYVSNRVSPGFFAPDLLNIATVAGACAVTLGSGMSARK
ncbi:MAG TPA: DMT family transporter [Gemmatimonadaceae bacterium]|nr:DMT family transporter [Gemmatimonadaceae bacterium]